MNNKIISLVFPLLLIALLIQLTNHFCGYDLIPSLPDISKEFIFQVKNGELLSHFTSSLTRVLTGYAAGSLIGFLLGLSLGLNKTANKLFGPLISILYPIPALGWLPILMIVVGVGEILPISIIFICSIFPIAYNTRAGIQNVPENQINSAIVMGADKTQIICKIIIPLALPYIFTGLRLEAGMAWRVVMAAEMIAVDSGLGALMMKSQSLIRMDIILICLILLSLCCLVFENTIGLLEKSLLQNGIHDA
jgi:NitT/TauT family transport system permease protein